MDVLFLIGHNICGLIVENNLDIISLLFLSKKQDIGDLLPYLGSFLAFTILELALRHLQGNKAWAT